MKKSPFYELQLPNPRRHTYVECLMTRFNGRLLGSTRFVCALHSSYEERQIQELERLAAGKPRQQRVEWIYQALANAGGQCSEEMESSILA
jgi:hypothetical protein